MIRFVSEPGAPPTPEDWRILRALAFYRLLLVTLQLMLYESGYLGEIFEEFRAPWFYAVCVGYALAALALLLPIVYRQPQVEMQAHLNFAVDAAAISALAYACGGVPSGLGMLLLTSAVGCSMVISTRMALVQAAGATLVMLAEEIYRMYPDYDTGPFTQTGILGLMFFATSLAANAVAMRARKSEAFAARVGSDLASLAQLNESVIEHMQAGLVVINADGRVRLLNAAAGALLPARRGDALAEAAPGLATALDRWRDGAPGVEGSPVAPRAGAEDVVPRFTRLGWGADAPTLILLENARALREQALQLNLAALGRLSAGIAHEIRNPLTAISHAGQLLSESPDLSAENQRLTTMIRRHSDRIEKIVRGVLALSRRDPPAPAPIRLRPWLEQAVGQYREGHREPRSIQFDGVGADFVMHFDPSHLQQVLFNLWDNSFLHGGRDGRHIEVALRAGGSRTEGGPYLEVRDNGPGIPDDLRERVFEPFFSTAHRGTGLGLYLARELCEYNRARLSYRTLPEGGACFRVAFAEVAKEAA